MSIFEKHPIVFEYKKEGNLILNKQKKVHIEYDASLFPVGTVFCEKIDGIAYTFKVIKHRFIGEQVVAIIVEDALEYKHDY